MSGLHHTRLVGVLAAGLVTVSSCSSAPTNTAVTTSPAPQCAMSEPVDQVLQIKNDVFGTDRVSVHFTPCTIDQPIPNSIVHLLHGAAADETQWPDVGIFDAADRAVMDGTMPPSILVAPDAALAYSCDCADLLLAHLIDEIEPAIATIAPVDSNRRAIGGISRGGGIALQVAGAGPRRFVAVGAHSSVDAPEVALLAIARATLPVRLDVGDDDGLIGASHDIHDFITANGGQSELVVGTGGHDRAYWRSQADVYIEFYASHLT